MKKSKLFIALLMVFGMIAAACGSDGVVSDAVDGAADVAEDTAEVVEDAVDGEDDAMEDDAMADGVDVLNVAYFAGWPLPPQIGQADGSFAEAVGVGEINWIPLPDGGSMADAMIAGDVDISYSIGLTPFAVKATNGAPIKMVGIAVGYADADNCIVQGDLGVTRENAADVLNGAKVLTPIGNVTHYKLLNIMNFLGVDTDSLEILPAESGDATAAAFNGGQVEVGCAFGGPLVTMTDAGGVPLLTGEETSNEVGIKTYDVTAVTDDFGEAHPEVVTSFLRANEEFNQMWAADPEGTNPIIATAAGMEEVGNFLSGPTWFTFPTVPEQLSADWMGGAVAEVMLEQLNFFLAEGQVDSVADDYSQFIDTSYLEAAQ